MFIQFFRLVLIFQKIKDIIAAVTIPVMAKCRIGHFAEAQILECLGVDMVDESEGWDTGIGYFSLSVCLSV